MDYKGQALSEKLFYYILISVSSIGWVYGYFAQSFLVTFYVWAGALAFCIVLCVPDWPIYNRNPVKWLDEIPASEPRNETPSKKGKKDKKDNKDNKQE